MLMYAAGKAIAYFKVFTCLVWSVFLYFVSKIYAGKNKELKDNPSEK